MKFSIITPCYNSGHKIKQAIGSVRGQININLEHIIQDGSSTDGSAEWLLNQHDLDVRSETDSGMYQAINRGWNRATGDILSWLNSDEQYLPGTLNKVAKTFEDNPDVDMMWGNLICINKYGETLAARREIPARAIYLKNSTCYIGSCTTFFRRKLWDSGILKLDESYKLSADIELYLRLLIGGVKSYHINDYLSLFEVGADNLSATQSENVIKEGLRIRKPYKTFSIPILRNLIKSARYTEKFLHGSYLKKNIKYLYAQNEIPNYKEVTGHSIGYKFNFENNNP